MGLPWRKPSPGILVGALGLMVGLAGIAFAAIPDSGGVIRACYAKHSGDLRVVDSAKDCRRNERAIAWNQKGPAGPPGPPGPTGKGIVARPAGSTAVVSKQYPEIVDFPLAANTWTRQPGELDELFGEATLQVPVQCYKATPPGDPTHVGAVVTVLVNGQELPGTNSNVGRSNVAAGETYTAQFYFTQSVLFPSFPTGPTTITAKVYDFCDKEHITWKRVALTVVGAR